MGKLKWLVLAGITVWAAVWALPDNKLHVVFCSVGEGDAILVTRGTTQMLVDGGPGDKVIGCLARYMPFYDRRIEVVILTHDQADHKNGLVYVRERYNVLQFEPILRRGDKLKLGEVEFEVLSPDSRVLGYNTAGKENNEGMAGVVKFGDFEVLLTADVPTKFYETGGAGVDVIKVPHHGSKTEWDGEWWKKVRPKLAVISVGKNSYGHPTKEVTETLRDLDIKTLRTDVNGDIEVISDGVKWWVK